MILKECVSAREIFCFARRILNLGHPVPLSPTSTHCSSLQGDGCNHAHKQDISEEEHVTVKKNKKVLPVRRETASQLSPHICVKVGPATGGKQDA